MENNLLKKVKLLFVEDDDIQRNELSMFLKRRLEKVYVAKNGEEGFEKYNTLKPDIVLTDLRMPKVDGLELVKKIREKNRLIPIIIVTAMNDKETILKSIDSGITNYIVKPVDTNELLDILSSAVKTILEINSKEFETIVDRDKINDLKNDLTKFLKLETGKGPSDIRVNLNYKTCELSFINFLTQYELSLITKEKNIPMVDHNRNTFFEDRSSVLEKLIKEKLSLFLEFEDVKSDSKHNELTLTFKLK